MKKKFKIIFVVLVYRNTQDLRDFFDSFYIPNSKVIVVNSYYDKETDEDFQKIATLHNADYLKVENKGYGAGNNAGIKFGLANYSFEWLVISNPDITISKFNIEVLKSNSNRIIAPKILTRKGKNQNPSTPFVPNKWIEKLLYKTYVGYHKKIVWLFYIWSRLTKIFYYTIQNARPRIFAPHGAFILIPQNVLKRLYPLFNEKMFLFNEEFHLGRLAANKGIEIVYTPEIVINHKEDGSVSLFKESIFNLTRHSFIKYYEYWNKSQLF